jgi:uncharacterized Ntn-hydrolase superfamily protein
MTYSIVARDPETGDLGVAAQTCFFAVGAGVPWVRAGVGAVASQAFGEPAYGPRVLDALDAGASAPDAIVAAQALDPGASLRQLGVVSATGDSASITGAMCVGAAGDLQGEGYAIQANMMANERVWPAMSQAYESATGAFVDRLLATLFAAEAAGGDARGAMSAALVIVSGERQEFPGQGVRYDLRVDAAERPLEELARLARTRTAFMAYSRGVDALLGGDAATALREIDTGLALLPDEGNLEFAHAGALLFSGREEEARVELRALIARQPSWAVAVRGFAETGLLPLPDGTDLDSFLR